MRTLIERPENPDQSGIRWLLVHHILRLFGIHSSKPLIAIFNSQIPSSCSLQETCLEGLICVSFAWEQPTAEFSQV